MSLPNVKNIDRCPWHGGIALSCGAAMRSVAFPISRLAWLGLQAHVLFRETTTGSKKVKTQDSVGGADKSKTGDCMLPLLDKMDYLNIEGKLLFSNKLYS